MWFGKHDPLARQSRRHGAFRPKGERLERRELMAIDLVNIAGSSVAGTAGPYGVLESGLNTGGGVGFSVSDVGDVNGDGYDDFVVGAPTIVANGTGPALGGGGNSTAYLVFGSAQVNAATLDWRNLTPQQRIGDLSQLGQQLQTNPTNGAPGFLYNGLIFSASQNPNSGLGASVAAVGDVNGDGFADFLIGAPGANSDTNTNTGSGRAYLVYGGAALSARQTKTVDLDNPTANSDINILTFVNNAPSAASGRAVGSAGDVLTDGLGEIAIGAPNASVNGLPQSGAVYTISGTYLRPARTATVPLQNVGQGGAANVPGVVFTGAAANDHAGFSVSPAGNFAGATIGNLAQSDFLIGSPQFNVGPGRASLIYGSTALIGQGVVTNAFSSIQLNRLGNGIPGITFTGTTTGDQTGYSVSGAGDFNADGVGDILIGSPGFTNNEGRVNLVFGSRATATVPAITGTVNLTTGATGVTQVELDGAAPGALAGFSVTAVGRINNDSINEILIGSPGFNNAQGIAYLIPGNPGLIGTFNLNNTETTPLQGLIIGLSQPVGTANYFGASVSGLVNTNGTGRTTDGDGIGDFVIGAPGFALNTSRNAAGGVYLLEGAFIPLPNVVSTAVTSPIGVGTPLPPYAINATTPADLTVYILSGGSNTPGFTPFRDIDPTTLALNGVAVASPNFTQTADLDGDGIPDASFTFTPRASLNLANGSQTFTVTARTSTTGNFPNLRYIGTAIVTVSGGGTNNGGNGGGLPSNRTSVFSNLGANSIPNLPFGERLVPSNSILGKLHYKPLPVAIVHRQFLPTNGFGYRTLQFYHPTKNSSFGANVLNPNNGYSGHGTYTLSRKVFSHKHFPNGTFRGRIKLKGATIPLT